MEDLCDLMRGGSESEEDPDDKQDCDIVFSDVDGTCVQWEGGD